LRSPYPDLALSGVLFSFLDFFFFLFPSFFWFDL